MKKRAGVRRSLLANPDGDKFGPNGKLLCKWCGTETKPPRILWCSKECHEEFRIRTRPASARHAVWRRDRGRCALCKLDCTKLKSALRDMRKRRGFEWFVKVARVLGIPYYRSGTLWHCDHVKPVVEGGGGCGLRNLRTLCLWCHKSETRKLRARLTESKRSTPCRSRSTSPPLSEPSRPKLSGSTVRARSKGSAASGSRKR